MPEPTRLLIAAVTALLITLHTQAAEPMRARVQSGVLVGTVDNGIAIFKGIPYAAPPIGSRRGTLPQPVMAWSGARQADEFGFSCLQRSPPHNVPPGSRAAQLSEDCLTLNIWAPRGARNAPVMVWIHGGGNEGGSSADIYYDGAAFARDGIVLVSLNYRLGALGFQANRGEANFGLWDQIAALKWVRDNISVFGGDPGNVTLFGESAGGQDTLALLTAAPARGLFQKAIMQSAGGGWHPLPKLEEVAQDRDGDWGPAIDGHLLKESPLAAIAAGRMAHVPLIIGTNDEEGSLLGPQARTDRLFPKLTSDDVAKLRAIYGTQASEDDALARLVFRDGYFASEAQWIAAKVGGAGIPVYVYRFEYVLSALRSRRAGAHHGSEVPFVFARLPSIRTDDSDAHVETIVHGCWVAFARTGKPACPDTPEWPEFKAEGQWMVFDGHPSPRPLQGVPALDLLRCRLAEDLPPAEAACPAR